MSIQIAGSYFLDWKSKKKTKRWINIIESLVFKSSHLKSICCKGKLSCRWWNTIWRCFRLSRSLNTLSNIWWEEDQIALQWHESHDECLSTTHSTTLQAVSMHWAELNPGVRLYHLIMVILSSIPPPIFTFTFLFLLFILLWHRGHLNPGVQLYQLIMVVLPSIPPHFFTFTF